MTPVLPPEIRGTDWAYPIGKRLPHEVGAACSRSGEDFQPMAPHLPSRGHTHLRPDEIPGAIHVIWAKDTESDRGRAECRRVDDSCEYPSHARRPCRARKVERASLNARDDAPNIRIDSKHAERQNEQRILVSDTRETVIAGLVDIHNEVATIGPGWFIARGTLSDATPRR
ncbi:hypothetical protein HNR16_002076 [Pseudoclavibacter chungangensis]|nr:hypothetical protein [Pseudoclavibacter chungangensis]